MRTIKELKSVVPEEGQQPLTTPMEVEEENPTVDNMVVEEILFKWIKKTSMEDADVGPQTFSKEITADLTILTNQPPTTARLNRANQREVAASIPKQLINHRCITNITANITTNVNKL